MDKVQKHNSFKLTKAAAVTISIRSLKVSGLRILDLCDIYTIK